MNHTPRPYNSETDLPAVLALKQVCTTPQNIYDRPTTSDLRRLLATFSEPPTTTSGKQSWQEALRGMSPEQAQRARTWTFSSPGLRNRTERHRIQAVTMFTRRSGT